MIELKRCPASRSSIANYAIFIVNVVEYREYESDEAAKAYDEERARQMLTDASSIIPTGVPG